MLIKNSILIGFLLLIGSIVGFYGSLISNIIILVLIYIMVRKSYYINPKTSIIDCIFLLLPITIGVVIGNIHNIDNIFTMNYILFKNFYIGMGV